MPRLFSACLLFCLAVPALAAPPSRIEAHYEVLMGSIRVAKMTETFVRTGDHYSLQSISEAVGLLAVFKPETITVNSAGTITRDGLRPVSYSARRKLDADRNARADFDWDHHSITLDDRAGPRTVPLPTGTQDRLSAMYQLMFLPLQNMKVLKLFMTNGSKVDDYTFEITPGQMVTVPVGTFRTVRLATVPEKNANRTEIWAAEDHANFPYKLVITQPDGGQFIQVLTGITVTP